MVIRCSRCGKEINNLLIRVETKFIPSKVSDTGLLEPVANLSEGTSELLCEECFNKYCDCIDSLNVELDDEYLSNMVEVIDDIQYDI